MSFEHAVQMLVDKELYFSSPALWPDPYETRISHPESHKVFAQCWCTKGTSDAMWRIYSTNYLGVRISTSTRKLKAALNKARRNHEFDYVCKEVSYLSQFEINQVARKIHAQLNNKFSLSKATEMLFMKRDAFDHEAEYRVVITTASDPQGLAARGFRISVEPKQIVDSILIDPRAPKELSEALIYYLKEKVGYKKKVARSVLYKEPFRLALET